MNERDGDIYDLSGHQGTRQTPVGKNPCRHLSFMHIPSLPSGQKVIQVMFGTTEVAAYEFLDNAQKQRRDKMLAAQRVSASPPLAEKKE